MRAAPRQTEGRGVVRGALPGIILPAVYLQVVPALRVLLVAGACPQGAGVQRVCRAGEPAVQRVPRAARVRRVLAERRGA
jgi:hypothetical protein